MNKEFKMLGAKIYFCSIVFSFLILYFIKLENSILLFSSILAITVIIIYKYNFLFNYFKVFCRFSKEVTGREYFYITEKGRVTDYSMRRERDGELLSLFGILGWILFCFLSVLAKNR